MKLFGIIFGCLMIGVAVFCVCKFCSYTYRHSDEEWKLEFDDDDFEGL